jgi:hypothetical protein
MSDFTGRVVMTDYMHFGHVAYVAYHTATGEVHPAPWHGLTWAEQKAWCEAARAVRESVK